MRSKCGTCYRFHFLFFCFSSSLQLLARVAKRGLGRCGWKDALWCGPHDASTNTRTRTRIRDSGTYVRAPCCANAKPIFRPNCCRRSAAVNTRVWPVLIWRIVQLHHARDVWLPDTSTSTASVGLEPCALCDDRERWRVWLMGRGWRRMEIEVSEATVLYLIYSRCYYCLCITIRLPYCIYFSSSFAY